MTPHRDRLLAGEYEQAAETDLDKMTKAELVAEAEARGLTVEPSATKADVRALLEG